MCVAASYGSGSPRDFFVLLGNSPAGRQARESIDFYTVDFYTVDFYTVDFYTVDFHTTV